MEAKASQRGVVAMRLPRLSWHERSQGFTLIELLVVIGCDQSMSSKAPLSAATWYRRAGGAGVIARFAAQDGTQFASP